MNKSRHRSPLQRFQSPRTTEVAPRYARLPVGSAMVMLAALASLVTAGCRVEGANGDAALYYLEVVNLATGRVTVNVLAGAGFVDARHQLWSGIFSLASDERRTFEMAIRGASDTAVDNRYLRWFERIRFYEANSDTHYRSYVYHGGCFPNCWVVDDDTLIVYRSSDGTKERLFVESSDRPFYLERDTEDPDLGRIVITFVPEADTGSEDAVE